MAPAQDPNSVGDAAKRDEATKKVPSKDPKKKDDKKGRGSEVGLGLIGFGLSFTFLGVILYFDRGLLALGNLFWLIGVGLLLGWQSTWRLFTNVNNLRGTVCFILGLFLIFVRWPIIGIILEIYGVIVLFGGFWSTVKAFLSQIPFVGWIIQYPLMVLEQLVRGSR